MDMSITMLLEKQMILFIMCISFSFHLFSRKHSNEHIHIFLIRHTYIHTLKHQISSCILIFDGVVNESNWHANSISILSFYKVVNILITPEKLSGMLIP